MQEIPCSLRISPVLCRRLLPLTLASASLISQQSYPAVTASGSIAASLSRHRFGSSLPTFIRPSPTLSIFNPNQGKR
ncbi:unnamed protein product [Linum trigynum]|uniref:Uncharacterized protein n=1 Tax=Linum trigynum TaxID=586398 RepID=A0AAV2DVI1_9ROSI